MTQTTTIQELAVTPQSESGLTFPEVIDNTARSVFISCGIKAVYQLFRNLGPKEKSVHLHAGGAFAAGLEFARKAFYDQGLSPEESIKTGAEALVEYYGDFECPDDSAKSKDKMLEALFEYFLEYPLGLDAIKPMPTVPGKHAIEFRFNVPLPFKHPETGNPLSYGGRFDMLGLFNGTLFAVDEKTTSQLGATWSKQWELDSQFTGYCWAAQQYGYAVGGAVIRGISILKTKFGHAQAIVYRPEWMIDRWYQNLLYDIEKMLELHYRWKQGLLVPSAIDKSICSNYGGCSFFSLCTSPDPEAWIPSNYGPRDWNPLMKGA